MYISLSKTKFIWNYNIPQLRPLFCMPAWHHFLCFHQYRFFFSNSTWEAFFWAQFCSSDKLIWCHLLLIVYFLSLLLPIHPKPTKFKTVECIFSRNIQGRRKVQKFRGTLFCNRLATPNSVSFFYNGKKLWWMVTCH